MKLEQFEDVEACQLASELTMILSEKMEWILIVLEKMRTGLTGLTGFLLARKKPENSVDPVK